MNILFSIMSFVFLLIYLIGHHFLNISFALIYPITILLIGGFYYYFYHKLKAENQKFTIIGDIEFTTTSIMKRIGDFSTEFKYDSINRIELLRHIPALNTAESKSGFFSYILTLDFKNSHKESLIVSDRPTGRWRDLSIAETIKTLKKLTSTNVIIK